MVNNHVQHPKVVVIGAGSLFFGRQAIWQMVKSPYLNNGTLSLVETDELRLQKILELANMVVADNSVDLKVEGSKDRKDLLKDADFVILSFAKDSVKYRGIDCAVSEKYGVRMCSGDTIGPGGIFRAMREFPVILECAKDIAALCPEAWVINYINPTAVHGIGLKMYAPELKSFALCDGLHMPHVKIGYAIKAGIIDRRDKFTDEVSEKFNFKIAGVNHFTWLIKAEYEGKDMTPIIAGSIKADANAGKETSGGDTGAKALFNNTISYELYKIFGRIPVCTPHTKEYLRFWQGHGKVKEEVPPLSIWETEERYMRHKEMWDQIDGFVSGATPIGEFMKMFGPDHATDIIENMVGGLGKAFYINTPNLGAVTNMSDDAYLELCCDVSMEGVTPHPVGDMPRGLRGLQETVLDAHTLTAEAVYEGSFEKLMRAMLTDPLVNSIGDADSIIKELLMNEKEALPALWYK